VTREIDIAKIVADRDQLWAEAVDLYLRGTPWWLDTKIEEIAAEKQAAFVEHDVWDGLIAEWVKLRIDPFTMEELFAAQTGITPWREAGAVPKADQMRAAACLKKLGFRKRQETFRGKRRWFWKRK
jgi:predicted P-loop ATPase